MALSLKKSSPVRQDPLRHDKIDIPGETWNAMGDDSVPSDEKKLSKTLLQSPFADLLQRNRYKIGI